MASLQKKGDSWYCQFIHGGKRHTYTIGRVGDTEANRCKANAENLLHLLKQGRLEIPRGCSVVTFIEHDGKPPVPTALAIQKDTTLGQLREKYLAAAAGGIESNTLYTAKIHFGHLEAKLGKGFILTGLTLDALQDYVSARARLVSAVTIKKELDTFRVAWNFGLQRGLTDMAFPSRGIIYPKTTEKLPFIGLAELRRKVAAGGDADELAECLYLTPQEMAELLAHVKARNGPAWNYPMFVFAAHTGARKSELIRSRVEDIDLAQAVATIREKKKARGKHTSRRVPISPLLAEALRPLLTAQQGKPYLFGDGDRPLSVQAVHQAFERAVKGSNWAVLKGWHALRHSFVSACASRGLDQRYIDEWVGHQTAEQQRRYRHLYPSTQAAALGSVFA